MTLAAGRTVVWSDQAPASFHYAALFAALAALVMLWRFVALSQLNISLHVDEAQYWAWSRDLQWGYYSKPPLIAALIAASTALFGDGVVGVKAVSMLMYPLAAAAVFLLAARLFDARVAFWAATIFLLSLLSMWLGMAATTDAPLLAAWAVSLVAYQRAIETDRWRDWLLLGAALGLGMLAKYTMAVFVLGVALHMAVDPRARSRLRSTRLYAAGLVAVACAVPNWIWNAQNGFATLGHTADITLRQSGRLGNGNLLETIAAQGLIFGPLLGLLLVGLAFSVRQWWSDRRYRLLLAFSIPLWVIVTLQSLRADANANWAAPAMLTASIAMAAWATARWSTRTSRAVLTTALALNVALAAALYHWPAVARSFNTQKWGDPYQRMRGWDQVAERVRPFFMADRDLLLLADNRTVLAHLAYELRDLSPRLVRWNPRHEVTDHYQLVTHLEDKVGSNALLLIDGDATPITRHFRRAQQLTTIDVPLSRQHRLHYDVWRLDGFAGYESQR
ncbi:MAG: glycosyltransferase family 39 protein [Burkholderiaceae bacterium]